MDRGAAQRIDFTRTPHNGSQSGRDQCDWLLTAVPGRRQRIAVAGHVLCRTAPDLGGWWARAAGSTTSSGVLVGQVGGIGGVERPAGVCAITLPAAMKPRSSNAGSSNGEGL